MSRKRRNLNGLSSALHRCCYTDQSKKNRCQNICIPRSSLCSNHIGYNLDQKAFKFCKAPCCGKPVSQVNYLVFNEMCEEHYLNGGKPTITRTTSYQSYPQNSSNIQNHGSSNTYRQANHDSSIHSVNSDYTNHAYGEHSESFAENQLIMDDFNVSDGNFLSI